MDYTKTLSVEELNELRNTMLEDGKVSREELDQLFAIKDQQPELTSEFCSLFAELGMKCLAEDGKIDEEEAQYLIGKIMDDGDIDGAEAELLYAIDDFGLNGEVADSLCEAFPDFIS